VSLTSCYKYILELPVASLDKLFQAAMSESGSAGMAVTRTWENVPIGTYTATVSARPTDLDTHPPTVSLPPADLAVTPHFRMRVEVHVNEVPELDQIVYTVEFDLPGTFEKTADVPPTLQMTFPGVTAAMLNLNVSGGDIPLTPELIEPRIHALYQANPSLAHNVQSMVPWPPGPDTTVQVTTDIWDDEEGSPGFRGRIHVEVPDPTHVLLKLPGHFRVQGIAQTYINTDMEVDVKVAVEVDTNLGRIRARLDNVQQADVTVTFVTAGNPIYDAGAKILLAQQIATRLRAITDPEVAIPTATQVHDAVADRIVALSVDLKVPVFTPPVPLTGEVDFTTFVPTTVNSQVLALQVEPRNDGTLCDTPDVVTGAADFSIAVAAIEVQPKLQTITQSQIGMHNNFAGSGHDVDVKTLDGTLSDPGDHGQTEGHVWISGSADVSVDCWPDPTIHFSGPVFLDPHTDPDGKLFLTARAGNFDADKPCCGNVDPDTIKTLVAGQESDRFAIPSGFSGVGQLTLTFTAARIFAAGLVVDGSLAVLTTHALNAAGVRSSADWWFGEQAGGG
jgi:hypothetical protein